MNILAKIDRAIAGSVISNPKSGPVQPGTPVELPPKSYFLSASWAIQSMLLREAGEPSESDAKKLKILAASWSATLAKLAGYSADDAGRKFKAHRAALIAGETTTPPASRLEMIRQNTEIRQAIRAQASAISDQACNIAADALERSLKFLPKLKARIRAEEREVFAQSDALGKTPLQSMLDDLPRAVAAQITKLRTPGANRNPETLLPLE
jgi:hypothetical protein